MADFLLNLCQFKDLNYCQLTVLKTWKSFICILFRLQSQCKPDSECSSSYASKLSSTSNFFLLAYGALFNVCYAFKYIQTINVSNFSVNFNTSRLRLNDRRK
jgi:hypothetical protein